MAEGAKGTATDVYILAAGDAGSERLRLLDKVYGPATRQMLLDAGLCAETRGLDLACGIGVVSCFMASAIGNKGSLVAADVNPDQLIVAKGHCAKCEHDPPIEYIETSAYDTGLPSGSFDLIHIRFLLCHLAEPMRALREVYRLLKPGGALVCQDICISNAFCTPEKELFEQSVRNAHDAGRVLGVNYDYGLQMPLDVMEVGFKVPEVRFIQPAYLRGPEKRLWEFTAREAMPTIIRTGAASEDELTDRFEKMRLAAEDEHTLIGQWGMPSVIAYK